MIIENFGVGARCAEALRLLLCAEADGKLPTNLKRCVLLPIPTSKDKVHLTGTDKLLDEVFSGVGEGDFIAGYGIDEGRKSAMRESGALVYDALEDEEFLTENAEQTAMGALGYILSSTATAPKDTRFAIVGYGRIGSRLLRPLLFLGAKVKVLSGREKTCIELGKCGVEAHYKERRAPIPLSDTDVIINTAPEDLSSSFADKKLPSGIRVIELASGENFKGIEGIERLPGIPDKFYPKSAGRTYFMRIMNYLSEVNK